MDADAREFEPTADGDAVRFERTGRDTGGDLLQMRVRYRANASPPPLHRHPHQEERFEVIGGRLWVRVGDDESVMEPGATFVVPAGAPHAMRAVGDDGAEIVWQVRPALDSEAMFRALWGVGRVRVGSLERIVIIRHHHREIELVKPPRWVQRLLFAVAATIAAVRGYRYPQ